jgi:hypothetical protein
MHLSISLISLIAFLLSIERGIFGVLADYTIGIDDSRVSLVGTGVDSTSWTKESLESTGLGCEPG